MGISSQWPDASISCIMAYFLHERLGCEGRVEALSIQQQSSPHREIYTLVCLSDAGYRPEQAEPILTVGPAVEFQVTRILQDNCCTDH